MPHPIILHHFDRSPFSEKIRVVFGHKGLSWRSVRIPPIMPKPDLMPLTGGYRRTPVMQIGADVFCDTQIIIREIERRFPSPTLFPPGAAGVPWGLSSWTDRTLFQNAVTLVFGALGPKVPQAFVEDRSQLRGAKFDLDKMRAAIPQMRDQLRAQLGWIETQLSDGRKWLLRRVQPCRRQRLHERLVRAVKPLGGRGSGDRGTRQDFRRPQASRGMGEPRASDRTRAARRNVRRRSPRHRCKGQPGNCRRERSGRSERAEGRRQGARRARRLRRGSKLAERSCLSRRSTSRYAASTNGSARSWSISHARAFSFSRAEGLIRLAGTIGRG